MYVCMWQGKALNDGMLMGISSHCVVSYCSAFHPTPSRLAYGVYLLCFLNAFVEILEICIN